jgi:hypothetical protein
LNVRQREQQMALFCMRQVRILLMLIIGTSLIMLDPTAWCKDKGEIIFGAECVFGY